MSGAVQNSAAESRDAKSETISSLDRAKSAGGRRARAVRARHGTADPYRIAEAEGVRIAEDAWDGLDAVRLLGTYANGVITLYDAQIERVAADANIDHTALRTAVCAHELAHYELETRAPDWMDRDRRRPLARITGWLGIGRPSRPSHRRLEEHAAHAFTAALLPDATASLIERLE